MSDRTLDVGGRQGRGPVPLSRHRSDERPNMLASRGFWIGGALSLAVWVVLGLIFFGGAA